MREQFTGRRNLTVSLSYRNGVPDEPNHWADQELAEWRQSLVERGKWTHHSARSWDNMMQARHGEQNLIRPVLYRGYGAVPDEVLATIPASIIAQGISYANPAIPMLSHALCQALDGLPEGGSPDRAAMERALESLRQHVRLRQWRERRGVIVRYGDGLALIGGLRIRFHAGRMTISLNDAPVIERNCTDGLLPALVALHSRWCRLVRMCVAEVVEHAVHTSSRSIDTKLQLVLPLDRRSGAQDVLADGARGLDKNYMLVLEGRDPWADSQARYAFAGQILAAANRGSPPAAAAIERAVRGFSDRHPLLSPITVEPPGRQEIETRVDDLSRQNIRALQGDGEEVDLLDASAERYEVLQDSMTGLYPIAEFSSFGLAVDFEYSNRKTVTMRLCMGVGRGRLKMPGEERMASEGAARMAS